MRDGLIPLADTHESKQPHHIFICKFNQKMRYKNGMEQGYNLKENNTVIHKKNDM